MRFELAYITNVGRLRENNEDAILVGDKLLSDVSMDEPEFGALELTGQTLFAVADGMGGLPCGEVASRLTLEYMRGSQVASVGELRELIYKVKTHLDAYVQAHGRCYGMGTAVAGVYLETGRATVFNVGDCRVYRRKESLELLTRDHTEAYELYLKGFIDLSELRHHPLRNALTSALVGGYPEEPEVFVREIEISSGESLLLCSDGLWDELSEEDMNLCLSMPTVESANCLFKRAYAGGRDNISFVLIRVL
ncbi:PP2C family protein-serine/threonine phosphatase [Hydrogenivirga sp.]